MNAIKELLLHERPRERLRGSGPHALSDTELMAIVLGSGNKQQDVLALAAELVKRVDALNDKLTIEDLEEIPGVGPAKASLVTAALEFARRRIRPEGTKISKPADVYPLVRHLADRKQEHFICVSLNGAHEVIATRVVTVGLVNSTQVHPREIFSEPLVDRACAIVVAHNHPSGNLRPSEEDVTVTKRLVDAGKLLGVNVLDHLIFSAKGYLSLKDQGLM